MDNNNTTLSFSFQDLPVRVIERNGEPWFVGKDVCNVLDIGNNRQAMTYLDDDEKGVIINDTLGGCQHMTIISESGLYSLVLRSRKPEAKVFKRWVTHEVLPAIRRTGKYAVQNSATDKILAEALLAAAEILREYRNGLPSAVPQIPQETRQDSAEEIREFFNDRGIGSFITCNDLARLLNLSRRVIKNSEAKGEFVKLDKSVYATESVIRWLIRKPRYLTKAPIRRTLEIQRHYVPSPQQILPSPELLNMRRTPNCCPCELVRGKERLIFRCISDALRFLCIEPGTIQPKSIRNLVIDGWYFIPALQK